MTYPAIKKAAIAAVSILFATLHGFAQVGKLDNRYYINDGGNWSITKVLVLPDSSVLVGGNFSNFNGRPAKGLAKMGKDGTHDWSFGIGQGISGTDANVESMARQADGKIIVAGTFTGFGGNTCNRIVRLNADGSVDGSFVTGTGFNAPVMDVLVQPDSTILVAGQFSVYNGAYTGSTIARLMPNGSLDTSFHPYPSHWIYSMARQDDGKILVGGIYQTTSKALRRLHADGSLDTTFNSGGAGPGAGPTNLSVYKVGIVSGGRICITGAFPTYNGTPSSGIAILNPNGSPYSGFDPGTGFGHAQAWDFVEQADKKIVVVGNFGYYNGVVTNRIARIDSTGARDTAFALGSGFNDLCRGVALLPDGSLLAGGRFSLYNTYAQAFLAKIKPDGSPAMDLFPRLGLNGQVYAIAKQSNGKTILVGNFTRFNERPVRFIVRLEADGSLDTAFGGGTGANNAIRALVVLPDDKILVAGQFSQYDGNTKRLVALLEADGTLDNSYNMNLTGGGVAYCMAQVDGGKILVGGNFTLAAGNTRRGLLRLNADLTLDSPVLAGSTNYSVGSVVQQADGRIIFTGASAGLARLDTLGNIDTSFHIGTGAPNAGTITLQADGKVLVGGTFSQFNGTAAKGLVRLNTDGTLDSGFALNTGPGQASIWKIIPYGTGMLIGGTFTAYHGSPRYGLAYLDSTGALGTGFDAEAGVGGAFTPTVNALCHDSYTGRVLAGGLFTATATGMPRRNFAAFTGEFDGIAIDSIRIDTLLCAGGTAKVVFKKVKPFNSGNVFTVLLSDSTGSFANPVAIGSKEAEGMGWDTVDAVIPSGMPQANGYKVKVISTNAANTSNPSNKFMVGKPLPPSVPGGSQTVCTADTAHTFIFDSIRVGSGGDKIIWSLTENFLVSDTIDNYDSISVTVLGFGADTVWLKSWNMAANLLSKTSFVTACKGRIPDTKSYHTMELALKDSAVAVSIYQSQLGVKYKLKLIDTYIDSTLGTGDTIVIRSNAISTNKSFVLIAYDTLSQCERIIDTISVKAFTFNPVDYSRATLYAQPDKSYFQIRQEIQSYIDSLHIYKALKKEEDTEEEEEDDVSRNFSRWVDFWDARVDKDGSIKASTEAMFDYLHPTVPNDCGESAFDPKWKCIGPFESNANRIQNQGRVIEITANPLNHSTIYMGSNSGGIWKTYDEGANWINVTDNDGYGGMGFTSIAINPEDTNHILAATGKNLPGTWVDGSDDAYTIGVIESLDGGASWHTTPISFDPSSSWSAEAPPYSPDLVLSKKVWFEPNPALGDITYYAITELQLYRVTNDVKTLLYEPPQQCGAYAYRILDAKQDNGFIYLSIYAYGPLLGCSTVVGNVPDIWVYDLSNNTVTTDIRDNFNYTLSNATIADSNLAQIRISTTNTRNINGDARLFAMLDYTTITTPQETQVVFSHSDDRGETWSVPVVTNNPLNIGFTDFIVSPNNENVIYVEGRSNPFRLMARSIDGGATFLAMPQTNIHVDVRAYKIYNPSPHEASMTTAWTGDGLLMGNDGGPAIKRIGGAWEPINGRGLTIGKYYGLGIDHENIHTTIAGAQDGSISGNVEGKWQTCNEGIGDRGDCINFEGSTDWLESWNWNLQLSQRNVPDNCATAGTFAYPSIGRGFRNFTLFPITQDPRDSNNIYIGWDNVASGVNQFSTTHAQDLDLTSITTYQASSIFRIRALSVAYDQSNERAVYYSLNDKDWGGNGGVNWGIYKLDEQTGVSTDISGSLYSSTDNTAPLRHAVITDIANEPDNAEHIFITFGNFQSGKKVFETTDDGETWTNITGCLPNFPANSILYQKEADRLIVGTDVGVYYRDASTSYIWKKMKGLPDVPIYDMELHECGQMLKVATYGRSIWEAYLPPLSELSIATNTTWNSNKDITQTVRIQPNTVLTVTNGAVINMARGTNIIVSIGAKLIVEEGSIITNGCGAMWDGIIMEGNKNEPQNLSSNNNNTATSNQPFVYLNDATIENAYEAIRVWKYSDGWVHATNEDNIGGTGGIVRAANTTFRNNRRSAEFMWYRNMDNGIELPNKSYFYRCNFTTDDNHRDDHPFSGHVSAWGVKDIKFLGCNFENARTIDNSIMDNVLGKGIRTISAGIIVDDYLPAHTIAGSIFTRSTFRNLQYGVHAMDGGMLYQTKVKHAQFENCIRGIVSEGLALGNFVGNSFEMGGNPAVVTHPSGQPVIFFPWDEGLTLRMSTGFIAEQNEFTAVASPQHITVGMRADITYPVNNRIYNNDFDEVEIANLSNRWNHHNDPDVPEGLQYLCNENADNTWGDIVVTEPASGDMWADFVGVRTWQGRPTSSAGNLFSQNATAVYEDESDFGNYATSLRYYYIGTGSGTSNSLYPEYHSPITVLPFNISNAFINSCPNTYTLPTVGTPTGSCGTCLSFSGYSSAFSTHKSAYKAYYPTYKALIDGGNTSARISEIDNAVHADTLMQQLSVHTPNLSAKVLEKVISQYVLLDDTNVFDLMRTNAEGVTGEIILSLYQNSMPKWMIDSVETSRKILTYRSYLLDTVLQHQEGMVQAGYNTLRSILEDTTGLDMDLYRAWLDSVDTKWAKYEMVKSYMHEAKYDTLEDILNAYDTAVVKTVADSVEYKNFSDYVLHYADWLSTDSSLMRLDSANFVQLLNDAGNNEHLKGTEMARNVLNFFYDSLYFTPPQWPEGSSGKKEDVFMTSQPDEKPLIREPKANIKLYPNPAKDRITIEYTALKQDTKLYILSMLGEVLEVKDLTAGNGKLELNTESYRNGVYLARITHSLQQKFVILK